MKRLIINTDGAARGNPGPASLGVVIKNADGHVVRELSAYLGEMTNNQAEYKALIAALETAAEIGAESIAIFADSELMVKQVKGLYKVKNEGLKPLFDEVKGLLRKFKNCNIEYVPREKNKEADKLANLAIDKHFKVL
ncbi:MAG: ribonuclease HI family protein [Deltaproteobacteria bacterium]|nr:ribonuclease HI family protein [Deltaproteobacteria bacterium]